MDVWQFLPFFSTMAEGECSHRPIVCTAFFLFFFCSVLSRGKYRGLNEAASYCRNGVVINPFW